MNHDELKQLANEIHTFIIENMSLSGGHIGAAMGVIELTIAMHFVFDTPNDKLIWDTGHQTHIHKILTGRKEHIRTIQQPSSTSSFLNINESIYDVFGAGHTSTSLSAALGMAIARRIHKQKYNIVAIIGDGAMSAGMAYEAINNMILNKEKIIIILNDNGMSISESIGGLDEHLKILRSNPIITGSIDKDIHEYIVKDTNFFNIFGIDYIGVVDGHDIASLISILQKIDHFDTNKPICLHVKTNKGNNYAPAQSRDDKFHSSPPFNAITGVPHKNSTINYSKIASNTLIQEMHNNNNIVAVSAAMLIGTSLNDVQDTFLDRVFDVGIAEQHAVTFCASMARGGLVPFCCIYSTFLQRAYDQIIHDVVIQSLPVRFLVDRAGVVGKDGVTHHGIFDICYLRFLPNIVIMSPSNDIELVMAIKTAININDRPSFIRYPKYNLGLLSKTIDYTSIAPMTEYKSHIVTKGHTIAIFCCGPIIQYAFDACTILSKHHIKPTIIDIRFIKPLDNDIIRDISKNHKYIITVEDGMEGGCGSAISEYLNEIRYNGEISIICHKESLIYHDNIDILHHESGISATNIATMARKMLENESINKA